MQSCESSSRTLPINIALVLQGVESMCCSLCEEPVRSLTLGLAAVGVVAVVRTVQKGLKAALRDDAQANGNADNAAAQITADSAS